MPEKKYKIIILGSGPAGLTAAIYAARANLTPLVIEGKEAGGQLMTTTEVENFPGFPKGITGPQLMAFCREQAERFGAEFLTTDATGVDFGKRPFAIEAGGKEFLAEAIIIATGASARRLGLESEKKLYGRGVSACATCDGFFFKDKKVIVVGGGDAAMEEANFLTRFASSVTIIHRRADFRASKIMLERAQKNPKISFIIDTVVEEVLGADVGRVTGARLKNLKTGETRDFACDGIFVAIGREPNTKLFAGQLELDVKNYIITKSGKTATSVEGVFAAGDSADSR